MNGYAPPLMQALRKDLEERDAEIKKLHERIEKLEKEVERLNHAFDKMGYG